MEHSNVFSFSSANRLINCPASRRMSKGIPNTTNPQAELGTAAHELGEHCLRYGFEPSECVGLTFNDHVVDEPMAEAVTVYVGYIRSLQIKTGYRALLEQRVVMTSLGRADVFGTSDCVIIAGDTLYIIDYKHGYGVVEVQDNNQAIGYALATLDTFNLWGIITRVVTTIVQPRKSHIDGPIRTATYTVTDLKEYWWPKYYEAVVKGENPTTPTVAGKHCKYCPARGFCRSRIMATLRAVYWDNPIDTMTDGEIEVIYSELEQVKTNVEAIQGRALQLARNGYKFNEYKLVDSITRYKCKDEKALVEAAASNGVPTDKLYERKLKSMSAVKKVLPWQVVNKFYEKPPASTTLVPMSDNRPAKRTSEIKFSAVPME